ncbi:MAG: hypothetical protein EXQ95_02310 [Alphaproteobacteria bacterium]|nr:hypothetical protein [Alphaproteobacteria bacterium]
MQGTPMSAFDLKLAEMLASRLCHDLINPVGAIAIGVELLSELDDTTRKDALDLVASSADRATKRISFFRVAYGFAGHDEGQSVQQVRGFAEGFLAGGKVALDWPARPEDAATALPRSGLKVLSGLIALAAESLPRGGTLAVAVDAPAGGRVVATGTGARIEAVAEAVLSAFAAGTAPDPASLEPRSVGAAYVGRLAQAIGAKVVTEASTDRVGFTLKLA